MPSLLPAALAVALALAGCLGGPPDAAPAQAVEPAAADPLMPLVWDLVDCEALTWEIPVPASRLATRLPAGYSPSPATGTPAGDDLPDGVEQAILGFEAVQCAKGFGSNEQMARSIPFARVYTPVIPPSQDADSRQGTQHAFVWETLVADKAWRLRLAANGLPAVDGGTLVAPNAQGYGGRLALDGVGTFSLSGRPDGNEQPRGDVPFRDFTPATGGVAAWVGERQGLTASMGVGVWDATAGSWIADVLGATQGVATFQLSHFTIPHEAIVRPGADGEPFMGPVTE
jgi:hypothetical protein